jgi:murein L,D-transpeptidase YcbB/YkuD
VELKPRYPFYTRLRGALAEYRRIAAAGGWETISAGGPLKPGVTDPRVVRLRHRLGVTGDLAADAAADASPRYDAAVGAGVKVFQQRHGLPVRRRRRRVDACGAERPGERPHRPDPRDARALPLVMHDLPERFVVVNVAGFIVAMMGPDGPTWDSPVVVGSRTRRRRSSAPTCATSC